MRIKLAYRAVEALAGAEYLEPFCDVERVNDLRQQFRPKKTKLLIIGESHVRRKPGRASSMTRHTTHRGGAICSGLLSAAAIVHEARTWKRCAIAASGCSICLWWRSAVIVTFARSGRRDP